MVENGATNLLKAGLVLALLAAIWFILAVSVPPVAALALMLALLLATLSFFTPSYFLLNDEGVTIRRGFGLVSRFTAWKSFTGCKVGPNGYWLIPANPVNHGLSLYRALFLPFPLEADFQALLRQNLEKRFPIL